MEGGTWVLNHAGSSTCRWFVFVPLVMLMITGMSNAVNITDGMDGLAAGTYDDCGSSACWC